MLFFSLHTPKPSRITCHICICICCAMIHASDTYSNGILPYPNDWGLPALRSIPCADTTSTLRALDDWSVSVSQQSQMRALMSECVWESQCAQKPHPSYSLCVGRMSNRWPRATFSCHSTLLDQSLSHA